MSALPLNTGVSQMLLRTRCQADTLIGQHPILQYVRWRWTRGPVQARKPWRREAIKRGEPSSFPVGHLTRVVDLPEVRATLNKNNSLRGLVWLPEQDHTCGKTYRVATHVQRILGDDGYFHKIDRTVTLEGVTCRIAGGGCGRDCPLFFRDEWLASSDRSIPASTNFTNDFTKTSFFVRTRSLSDIQRTLLNGSTGTIRWMPEFAELTEQIFPAHRLTSVHEDGRDVSVTDPAYILHGARCFGTTLSCDKRCSIVWHGRWLEILTNFSARKDAVVPLSSVCATG